jgi:hypothetical protein
MKKLSSLFLILFLISNYCSAQDESNKQTGKSPNDFVPKGWQIIKSDTGDLNKDGQDDIVFVMENSTHKKLEDAPIFTDSARTLLILFKDKEQYTLSTKHTTFIMLGTEGGTMGDPFSDLFIKRGVLNIEFLGGSRELWQMKYKFRFQNEGWYLIGEDDSTYDRLTGGFEERSYNYLTHKEKHTKGTEGQVSPKRVEEWSDLKKEPLKKFKDFSH